MDTPEELLHHHRDGALGERIIIIAIIVIIMIIMLIAHSQGRRAGRVKRQKRGEDARRSL